MNFDEIINNRRSARHFTQDKISENQLEKILLSGSLAPSAKNRQPWKFYILDDKQKNDIMNMLFKWDTKNQTERTSVKGSAEQIRIASKMIMIYSDKYKSLSKNENYKKPDYISLGCALENMSLQAVNLGLGTCILCDTLYIENEIDTYLGIKNFEQICGFIIGKPIYNHPPKNKKTLKELLLNKTT